MRHSTATDPRRDVVRRLFDAQNGFGVGRRGHFDFLVEDLECLLDDELSIEGDEPGVTVPPFVVRFSPTSPSTHFAVADEDGKIRVLDSTRRASKACVKEWAAHNNAIFDVAWLPADPGHLLSGSGDQTIALWDVASAIKISTFRGHSSSVKTVSVCASSPFIFASGGRDGAIRVWDKRCDGRRGAGGDADSDHQARHALGNAHMSFVNQTTPRRKKRFRLAGGGAASPSVPGTGGDSQWSVTSVLFQGEHHLVSSGAKDGTIKVWDLRQLYQTSGFVLRGRVDPTPAHILSYAGCSRRVHGYTSLVIDSTSSRLFASCTDDIIYAYDLISYSQNPFARFFGHDNKTFYVKAALSPDDEFLVSGSGDSKAYVWSVRTPNRDPVKLKGHTSEVSSVDWCPSDGNLLVTASDDNSVRVWRLNRRTAPPEAGVVSGIAKREPVPQPDFNLTPRTPGGASTPRTTSCTTPTTPTRTPRTATPRTPGSGSSMGFTPRSNSTREFYSPSKTTPLSPLAHHRIAAGATTGPTTSSSASRTLSPMANFFSPRALHYGNHTPTTPTRTPTTRRKAAALKGMPSRKPNHGSPSIQHWLRRMSPIVNKPSSPPHLSHALDSPTKSFDSHPFNLAAASSSSATPLTAIASSPRKLLIKSPTRSPLTITAVPNGSGLVVGGVGAVKLLSPRSGRKRKRNLSDDGGEEEEEGAAVAEDEENASPQRRLKGSLGRAGPSNFDEETLDNNNYIRRIDNFVEYEEEPKVKSLIDRLPESWRSTEDSRRQVNRDSQQRATPTRPSTSQEFRDATPARATTTPKRRSSFAGKRLAVSGSVQKCIKFNQDEGGRGGGGESGGRTPTILRYFAKKSTDPST